MANVICFFNNKGGVGKTTTSTNVSAGLTSLLGKKVLYIDLDPQCNSTLLILGEDKVTERYWTTPQNYKTIFNIISPILDDDPNINFEDDVIYKGGNRFGVDLIMGHPRLSALEDRLGESWVKVPGGDIGAFRKTNWLTSLLENVNDQYDYVIIDLGPSLGSLNRSALIAADYFVTPMSIDIFSIIGLRNIKDWLDTWQQNYHVGIENLERTKGSDVFGKYTIKNKISITEGCLGYTSQSYATRKNVNGERRPTKAYENVLTKFDEVFLEYLGGYLVPASTNGEHILGNIPNMFSLAPIAQNSSSPIRDLKSDDGIFGAHYSQAKEYAGIFDCVAKKIDSKFGVTR
ncbi:ParA family protein [Aeromonas veronii]|uniref:ParA family protein n=1 Tax=Aeromonas veronii TaxID=654 RepID=UPI0009557C4F|nr:AAA family ATPase [Aeromonas veronii]SIQ63743.1 AAA domain-containing protein [Aeromonas veronii]